MTFAWKKTQWVGMAAVLVCIAPTPAQADDEGLAGRVEQAKRATVGVLRDVQEASAEATKAHFSVRGSGFHIRDGYIVTARHAVKREEGGKTVIPKQIMVLTGNLDELPAELTGVDPFLDIAVYRITTDGASSLLTTAPFGEKEPEAGDEVFTVGYPLGWGPTVGFGRIGNPKTFLPTLESRLYQVDLSACSGNSGGGLFNAKGEIVGVVHAIIQTDAIRAEGSCSPFAFAVPGPLVQRITTALIEGAKPAFAKLGIRMTAVKIGTRWRVAVAKATGPALKAGIRKGDILLSIDDTDITDAAQLKSYLIERTTPGQRVALRVLRSQAEHLLFVTLGKS